MPWRPSRFSHSKSLIILHPSEFVPKKYLFELDGQTHLSKNSIKTRMNACGAEKEDYPSIIDKEKN